MPLSVPRLSRLTVEVIWYTSRKVDAPVRPSAMHTGVGPTPKQLGALGTRGTDVGLSNVGAFFFPSFLPDQSGE